MASHLAATMHDVSGTTDASSTPRRLFLLDGHSLAYRAFFALPPTLATSSGTVTNAVYGFTSMLIKLLGDEHPGSDRGGVRHRRADRPAGDGRRVQGRPARDARRLRPAADADRGGARHPEDPGDPGRGARGRRRARHAGHPGERRGDRRGHRHGGPRLLPAGPGAAGREGSDLRPVQPPRHLRDRSHGAGRDRGEVRRLAGELPRLRCAEGRHLGQHPRRPRGGREDGREAGPGVRLGRGSAGPVLRAPGEAEGERRRPPPTGWR